MTTDDKIRNPNLFISDHDRYLFNEGNNFRAYEMLGAKIGTKDGVEGTYFSVWAPNAERVYVVGDFNNWDNESHPLETDFDSGIWEGFIAGVGKGDKYKYYIRSRHMSYRVMKADPYAYYAEIPARTASVVWDLDYEWNDGDWMSKRWQHNQADAPHAIYEVHLGSWMRDANNNPLGYRELAQKLTDYVKMMGFTHIEFLPLTEYPFDDSWGYQATGYFAPTSRYGTPQDFMYLVDTLHQNDIGVIIDWVPSHFPTDEHGLNYFDGTHLYEHSDPRQGFHPDWKSSIFNYGRTEVRSFLLSSALFWLEKYHIDGIRVDAVASMLYLDYSRNDGEWIPNMYGGNENLEAIDFLRQLNKEIYGNYPDVMTTAEESTAWPMVSRPIYVGGLGFGFKWDMGWMHDTLSYMQKDPIHRQHHHHQLTFRMLYAWSENYALPLSHDEVVHGKGSLLRKMPGDEWQRFANLRVLFTYMYAQPAKKLLFMGGEIAQWNEWYHKVGLDWHLLESPLHKGVQTLVRDLNSLYRREPALHELDTEPAGFEWVDANDNQNSVLTMLRYSKSNDDVILVALNFTPIVREGYVVGVPRTGLWQEIFNSDATIYGGSGVGNSGAVHTEPAEMHGREYSLSLRMPPLGGIILKMSGGA